MNGSKSTDIKPNCDDRHNKLHTIYIQTSRLIRKQIEFNRDVTNKRSKNSFIYTSVFN